MRENQQDLGVGRVLNILNHLFLLERKIDKLENPSSLKRHIDRIYEEFSELGYVSENPMGQPYSETRTDCEASIAGESLENLVIVEVVKPLVRARLDGSSTRILQRAVVVVASDKATPSEMSPQSADLGNSSTADASAEAVAESKGNGSEGVSSEEPCQDRKTSEVDEEDGVEAKSPDEPQKENDGDASPVNLFSDESESHRNGPINRWFNYFLLRLKYSIKRSHE